MQLVHKYAIVAAVRFKEGAIEAVMQQFHLAEELLGNIDGVFDCKGHGMVQLYAPITARWVLYNPNANADDNNFVGSTGRAEIEFSRFVGMDRHGGELTGDINVKDPAASGGADGEAGGGCSGPPAVPQPPPGGADGAGAAAAGRVTGSHGEAVVAARSDSGRRIPQTHSPLGIR